VLSASSSPWLWSGEADVDGHAVPFEHMKGVTADKNKPLTTSYFRASGSMLAATINAPEKERAEVP
jgi:hypothetical protein